MAEETKKISFGFAKSIKKPVLKNTVPQEKKKVDYIECLDEKGIKVIGEEEKKDDPLVIPLLGSKTWHDRIINKIDADIFETKTVKISTENTEVKTETPEVFNGKLSPNIDIEAVKIKTEPEDSNENNVSTLEQQAAKEIIAELKDTEKTETESKLFTLPLTESQSLRGEDQSTLDDYEKIPVDAFGIAMLRGMGWQPGKGIGKNEKIVPAVIPELRPKGMGLGADKVTAQKQSKDTKKSEEELKLEKGSFVKIIAGKQSGNYGQIEGFDDDAGRLIVKLALGGNTISLSEFTVQPVTKSEFIKNGKVLNAKKYEEYKDKEVKETKKRQVSSESLASSDSDDDVKEIRKESDKNKSHRSHGKKSKSRKRHSDCDSDSDSERGKKAKRRSRSTSRDSYKSKKVKKSKKNKRHDSSSERSSKKHKKKDKEREKIKDKKSRESEHTDRRKHKKRGRSRSRSSNRR